MPERGNTRVTPADAGRGEESKWTNRFASWDEATLHLASIVGRTVRIAVQAMLAVLVGTVLHWTIRGNVARLLDILSEVVISRAGLAIPISVLTYYVVRYIIDSRVAVRDRGARRGDR